MKWIKQTAYFWSLMFVAVTALAVIERDSVTFKQDIEVEGNITNGGVEVPTISSTSTFTNKTIDADNNTVSNLAHGAEVDNPTSGVHGATGTIVGTSDTQTLTNKTLTSPVINTGVSGTAVLDEDDMSSNSNTQIATQQSIKAYVDANVVSPSAPQTLQNVGLVASVGASALTIDLTDSAGSTPSGATFISFRSATDTTGLFTRRTISTDLDITVPSTATLGCESGSNCWIYTYAIDNAGTIEVCVSTGWFDEALSQSSTAIDTSADTQGVLYCDSTISDKPIRMLGRFKYDTSPNGTYSAIPDDAVLGFYPKQNAVDTSSTSRNRIESAEIDCVTASESIARENGSWLTSITYVSGGQCTLTIDTGIFSAEPYCVCSSGSDADYCEVVGGSATSVQIINRNDAGANVDNASMWLICFGPAGFR